MLKNIISRNNNHLMVSHYGGASMPYSSNNDGAVGMVRYNPVSTNIETWNGSMWVNITSHVEIGLTDDVTSLLEWARTERNRQLRYEEMAKNNVTIADALESVKDAELRLHELAILCEEGSPNQTK